VEGLWRRSLWRNLWFLRVGTTGALVPVV
jgi:hypothetical protein